MKKSGVYLAVAGGIAFLLVLAFAASIQARLGGLRRTTAIDDIGEAVASALAVAACIAAALRNRRRTRLAWVLLAASALAWTAGEGIWSFIEVIRGQQVPFPSWPDVGYLLAVP